MCFSAEASFTLGAALTSAGAYCVVSALRKGHARAVPLALVPLAFGLQQLSEGWVWVELGRENAEGTRIASLVFLFFALFFWPFWIPWSIFTMERRGSRKVVIGLLGLIGMAGGLTLFLSLLVNPDVLVTRIEHHSIHYDFDRSPVFQFVSLNTWKILYILIVAAPILMAERRREAAVGVVLVLLAAITHLISALAFVSLWCFFAAALSLYLVCYFYRPPAHLDGPKSSGGDGAAS